MKLPASLLLTVLLAALLTAGSGSTFLVFGQLAALPLVRVAGQPIAALSAAEAAKLPRITVKTLEHDGHPHTYEGIALHELLRTASVKMDCRGDAIAQVVQVQSQDGYRTVLAIAEVSPELATDPILLADRRDGQPLPAASGPWQLIVPHDRKPTRWVRQVRAVSVAVPPADKL